MAPYIVKVLVDGAHQGLLLFHRVEPLHDVLVFFEVGDVLIWSKVRHDGDNVAIQEGVQSCTKQDQDRYEDSLAAVHCSDVADCDVGYSVDYKVQSMDVETSC